MSNALLFGINYSNTEYELKGCCNDVYNMAEYLVGKMKYTNISIYTDVYTPTKVTTSAIIKEIQQCSKRSHSENLERVWLHFSCHGTQIRDISGDEDDGKDECICPLDFTSSGVISDDIIHKLLTSFNPKTNVVCVFDCCHSGTIGDLPYMLTNEGTTTITPKFCQGAIQIISGCMDDQTSADAYNITHNNTFTGVLTSCLLESLRSIEQYTDVDNINMADLYSHLKYSIQSKYFKQKPIITSNIPCIEKQTLQSNLMTGINWF